MTIERHAAQYVVIACEERFKISHVNGAGSDAVMNRESLGWFVVLDNNFAYYIGSLDPKITPGTCVALALEIPR